MSDPWRALAAMGRVGDCSLITIFVIPEMDQIVMNSGMCRGFGDHLLCQGVNREAAGERNSMLLIIPELKNQERLGFKLVWKLIYEFLQRTDQLAASRFLIALLFVVIVSPRVDPSLFPRAGL